ncbi:MAG: hypothetical protein AAF443_06855 [Chlamydiota bacterium]
MAYRGRALYNLLAMNFRQQPSLAVESWQVEDYRQLAEKTLFDKLQEYAVDLGQGEFLRCTEEFDSPENLTDWLYRGDDFTRHEQIFLCLFELWRRLACHKLPPSIFCDELDHLIESYEAGNLECENRLQDSLLKWQGVLEDHVDEGGDWEEAFDLFSEFSCHDLERFVYEYAAHQIDVENDLYASELLEGFFGFVKKKQWFEFLRLRLVFNVDPEEGRIMVERLLESLDHKPETQLLFEVLHFLIYTGEFEIFTTAFRRAFDELKCEGDLRELMMIASDYMNCMERFSEEKKINDVIDQRKEIPKEAEIDSKTEILQKLKEWVILAPSKR